MDWLRRNWPDLLIGVALVAVVALIVVTLLSGGSLASLVRRDGPPEFPITETTSDGAAGDEGSSNAQTADNTSGAASNGSPGSDGAGSNTSSNSTDGGVDVFVPGVPGGQAGAAASASGGQAQASTTPGGAAGTASGGVTQGSGDDADDSGPLPEATQRGGFRVAAGAVDSRDAAASLAESYRDAGYTVTVEQQNDLYLLWVGPYAARVGADRVAARLQTDGLVPDALVYTYSGPDISSAPGSASGGNTADSAAGNVSTGPDSSTNNANNTNAASSNTAASVGNGSADSAAASGTPANTVTSAASTGGAATSEVIGPRYLQVGAFVSDEGAQPLREELEALGFSVTRRVSETGLVRLLVGPFPDAQLAQAQARLTSAGIPDAFPVVP